MMRQLLNFAMLLGSLGMFRARVRGCSVGKATLHSLFSSARRVNVWRQGTATFRKMFGFTEVVGSSPLAILPAQCAMTLHFYWKALINLTIPVALAVGAVVISLVALVVRHVRTRKLREHLQNLHPELQHMSRMSLGGGQKASPVARRRRHDVRRGLCEKLAAYFSDKQYLSTAVFVLFLSYNLVGSSVRCESCCTLCRLGVV